METARNNSTSPRLLHVTEAALRLGRSAYTLRKWIRAGLIPVLRFIGPAGGPTYRFDPDELDQWIEKHRRKGKF